MSLYQHAATVMQRLDPRKALAYALSLVLLMLVATAFLAWTTDRSNDSGVTTTNLPPATTNNRNAVATNTESGGQPAQSFQTQLAALGALPACADTAQFAQWMSSTPPAYGIAATLDPKYFQLINLQGAPVMPFPATDFIPFPASLGADAGAACMSVGHLGEMVGWEIRTNTGALLARGLSYLWGVDSAISEPYLNVRVAADGLPQEMEAVGHRIVGTIGTGELFEGFAGGGLLIGAVDNDQLTETVHDRLVFIEAPGLAHLSSQESLAQLVMTSMND